MHLRTTAQQLSSPALRCIHYVPLPPNTHTYADDSGGVTHTKATSLKPRAHFLRMDRPARLRAAPSCIQFSHTNSSAQPSACVRVRASYVHITHIHFAYLSSFYSMRESAERTRARARSSCSCALFCRAASRMLLCARIKASAPAILALEIAALRASPRHSRSRYSRASTRVRAHQPDTDVLYGAYRSSRVCVVRVPKSQLNSSRAPEGERLSKRPDRGARAHRAPVARGDRAAVARLAVSIVRLSGDRFCSQVATRRDGSSLFGRARTRNATRIQKKNGPRARTRIHLRLAQSSTAHRLRAYHISCVSVCV